jgi:hypothetical protein
MQERMVIPFKGPEKSNHPEVSIIRSQSDLENFSKLKIENK